MKIISDKRMVDFSWDYQAANTKELTHCYHSYPAMMIPQIARRLIKEFSNKNTRLLFDPYCGTGTSLLEANLTGINAIGTDLNPLARLIAKCKTTPFDLDLIYRSIKIIQEEISKYNFHNNITIDLFSYQYSESKLNGIDKFTIPDFPNIDYWFSKEVKSQLAFLKHLIEKNVDSSTLDFFWIAFSECARDCSYTRNSEFKLFRIPTIKMKEFNPDPFQIFFSKIQRNINGLKDYLKLINKNVYTHIYDFNTCDYIPEQIFSGNEIDIIITSPPYGDSRTTVAYGQFSRLSSQWLGFKNANKLDSELMGGNGAYRKGYLEFESAKGEFEMLKAIDVNRYNDVQSFLIDYSNSIKNISDFVRHGAYVCYVLGNRTVKNIQIPLDLITVELFQNHGFEHIKTIIRNIPNKRMPKKNSPTNQTGVIASTMNNEYIVILKKI